MGEACITRSVISMKMVALVGSIRKDSYNKKLAKFFQKRYKDIFDVTIADIESLPFYNQDMEDESFPSVLKLIEQIDEADAVLIVTPEYNWSISGVLKNALDWLSRGKRVLNGKPVLIAGAAQAMLGTVRAQMHLRDILSAPGMGALMMPPGGNEILINQVSEKFDEQGNLVHQPTLEFLDIVVNKFVDFLKAQQFAAKA